MTDTHHGRTGSGPGGTADLLEPATSERVATLRGAQVAEVDPARLRRIVVIVCALALAVTAVVLFVAGARRNAQAAALHDRGVQVTATVTGCHGNLGGGGYTFVSYACRAAFTFQGHHYDVAVPGSSFHRAGTTVALVADRADPRLVATVPAAARAQPSATVYLLPGLLVLALVALSVTMGLRRSTGLHRSTAHAPRAITT